MTKISAIILTKNEEKTIEECLKSLEWCDEIIVVDDYSIDSTIEKVKNYLFRHAEFISASPPGEIPNQVRDDRIKVKIFQRHLNNDFAGQRNFGLEKAKGPARNASQSDAGGDWVLFIDSDERVTPELVLSIKNKVLSRINNEITAYKIKRKNFYYGNCEWPKTEKLERLFKKDKLKGWQGELHESPVVEGQIGELEGYLFHYTHQNLTSMVEKTIKWSEIEANLRFKAGHPPMTWWRFPRVMLSGFCQYYFVDGGFKAGTPGLIESLYQSFSLFITYARLWEKQKKVKSS